VTYLATSLKLAKFSVTELTAGSPGKWPIKRERNYVILFGDIANKFKII